MTDRTPAGEGTVGTVGKIPKAYYVLLGAVCALVIGLYAWSAKSGWLELWSSNAENTYYNLLVRGFRAGQLNLKCEAPSGLAQLTDPYDPKANSPYLLPPSRFLDLSYYRGKLYLYFGVTPALLLFWPYAVLTGHYLLHRHAVVFFLSVGLLVSVGLLWAVWRRYFSRVSLGVVAAGMFALGLATSAPLLLAPCDVYEVAISCGYALTMVTLALLWRALHARRGQVWWLAGASLAYGLAVGARPSLLFGAVILLVPVAMAWREREGPGQRPHLGVLLLAATGPIFVLGFGLMLYNLLRFDDPFEFGWRYQLCWDRQDAAQGFSLRYLWFNFRVYFLEAARWSGRFPFVHGIAVPSLPAGHAAVQHPFGILTNIPLVWLALAWPLVWRGRPVAPRSAAGSFGVLLVLLFGICTLTLCLFFAACLRYELEFTHLLVLLAVIGILGLECTLAGRRAWRLATRCGWGLLLVLSAAFNLLAMVEGSIQPYILLGRLFADRGQPDEAAIYFQKALQLQPDNAQARNDLGTARFQQGRMPEAIDCFEQALRLEPEFVGAHNNLGKVLFQQGKVPEAIAHYEMALQFKPDDAGTHNGLGVALVQQGKVPEAVRHYEQALRIMPGFAEAHNNLGIALFRQGRMPEAIEQYGQALRLKPDYPLAHYNLGTAFSQQGRLAEAMGQYEQALQLKPDFVEAHINLGIALFQQGKVAEAIEQYEQTLRLRPGDAEAQSHLAWVLATCPDDAMRNGARAVELARAADSLAGGTDPSILDTLAAAYAAAGRFGEAVRTAERAVELLKRAGQAEQTGQIQGRLKLYQAGRPYHERSASAPSPSPN